MQRLGRNVAVVTNTHATIGELLDPSFSICRRQLADDDEVKEEVHEWLHTKHKEFMMTPESLRAAGKKCTVKERDYVEGY
jgi:hypothetical protein